MGGWLLGDGAPAGIRERAAAVVCGGRGQARRGADPMTEVVTLGECLVAFVATTPGPLAEATTFERFVVGAEANVAVGLARLGHSVAFIGRVGADGFGEAIVRRLRGEGVDITDLAVDPDAADRADVPRTPGARARPGRLRAARLGGLAPDRGRRRAGAGATWTTAAAGST